MTNLYNRIQGRNLNRLAGLSDGVFAVAMTLLVLDIHVPSAAWIHSEGDLLVALGALGPQGVAYLMSFLTLGIFWAGQQTQPKHMGEGTRDLTWIHLGFLFAITMMPLSTRLMAEFHHLPRRAGDLLAEYLLSGRHALLELGARHPYQSRQGRYA